MQFHLPLPFFLLFFIPFFSKKIFNKEDISKNINLLTPGDFKAVRDKLSIINNEKISWNEIIKELKLEVQYKLNDEYYKKFNNN